MAKRGRKQKETGFIGKLSSFVGSRLFSVILVAFQVLLTIVLLSYVLYINMLPLQFFIPICFVLCFLCGTTVLMAYSKKCRVVGKVISLLMIIISAFGIYYLAYASGAFENMSGANTKTDVVNVYVMKADKAEDLTSAKDYTFGIMATLDRDNTDKTVNEIEDKLGQAIKTKEYPDYLKLVDAMYFGEVQAIILNSAYVTNISENPEYESFTTLTRVLLQSTHESQIEVDTSIKVDQKTFAMYLSGIDIEGKISTTSRSDVNIIAIVNPDTRQVLLVNTPRDYYVPLSISHGIEDKLTHAGLYGVDVSMETLEMIYDIKLDYYFRINFTGFKDLIDALGGINVYSKYAFTSTHGHDRFQVGYNEMNGKEALGFVRERYSFKEGDNQRGKNQMEVIKAVAQKVASPAILNDYAALMNSVSTSFETSMSSSQISSLVRMQLNDNRPWNIVSYSSLGNGAKMPVYSMSQEVYVTIPDEDSIQRAKELIQMVYDGKTLTESLVEGVAKEE